MFYSNDPLWDGQGLLWTELPPRGKSSKQLPQTKQPTQATANGIRDQGHDEDTSIELTKVYIQKHSILSPYIQ